MSFRVTGLQGVMNSLRDVRRLSSELETQCLDEIGLKGVGILKRNVPVDSGRLRNSMGYTIGGRVEGSPDEPEDAINPNSDRRSIYIGTNVVYADRVEYMARNGSQGYFLRSFRLIKPMAEGVYEKYMRRLAR